MPQLRSSDYRHIFFDLDHTLWDFETNSRITLLEIFDQFELLNAGVPHADDFIVEYEKLNAQLWSDYREGRIDKPTLRNSRFGRVLNIWDIKHDELARKINEFYLGEGPKKTNLLPNAIEVLEYLNDRYKVHLITNGFKEVQYTKLHGSGLHHLIENITTSEETGFLKPDRRVFEIALQETEAEKHESIYVGDHYETDVIGSRNAGIDQVFFNPKGMQVQHPPTYDIRDLIELKSIL